MISYFIMGYMLETMGFTLSQLFLAYILMYIGNFAAYLYGMSRGVMFATTKRPNFIKELDKINELMREENNTTSKPKCTKCSRKDGTCGCGRGKKNKKDTECSSGGCDKC
jgi:hypothetical protein